MRRRRGELRAQRLGGLRRRVGIGLRVARAQRLEGAGQRVDAHLQRLDVGRVNVAARQQVLDVRFQAVRHLAQAHRAGQPRAALERVQRAHAGRRARGIAGAAQPVAHLRSELRQQLLALFLEDREQLGVHRVDRIDVVGVVQRVGACVLGVRLQRLDRGQLVERFEFFQMAEAGGRCEVDGHGLVGEHRQVDDRRRFRCDERHCARIAGFGGLPLHAVRRFELMLGQALQQLRRRAPQEAGGELVQQAAQLVGHLDEQACLAAIAEADGLRAHQRMLERARQLRQIGEADRGRIAGQRMRQCDRRLAHRAVQLERPFGQLGAQAARLLVGLVEEDVEQRDADAQLADNLDLLEIDVVVGGFGRRLDGGHVAQIEQHRRRLGFRRRLDDGRRCLVQRAQVQLEGELLHLRCRQGCRHQGLDHRLGRRRGQLQIQRGGGLKRLLVR